MAGHQYASTCRLTPHAAVRTSTIEGLGLLAIRPIAAGEPVLRPGGELIDDATPAGLTPPYSSLTVEPGGHLLSDPAHPVRYGNHACDPNLWRTDAVTVVARRDIAADEEPTIDYATHSGIDT